MIISAEAEVKAEQKPSWREPSRSQAKARNQSRSTM